MATSAHSARPGRVPAHRISLLLLLAGCVADPPRASDPDEDDAHAAPTDARTSDARIPASDAVLPDARPTADAAPPPVDAGGDPFATCPWVLGGCYRVFSPDACNITGCDGPPLDAFWLHSLPCNVPTPWVAPAHPDAAFELTAHPAWATDLPLVFDVRVGGQLRSTCTVLTPPDAWQPTELRCETPGGGTRSATLAEAPGYCTACADVAGCYTWREDQDAPRVPMAIVQSGCLVQTVFAGANSNRYAVTGTVDPARHLMFHLLGDVADGFCGGWIALGVSLWRVVCAWTDLGIRPGEGADMDLLDAAEPGECPFVDCFRDLECPQSEAMRCWHGRCEPADGP